MKRMMKAYRVIERKAIGFLNYVNPKLYMNIYCRYLRKIGIRFSGTGRPNYIDPTARFDGVDYSLITLGANDVISREVLFLTHDYSIFRALKAIGKEEQGERITKPIRVGDNVFIGARATLLPGVSIGENTIIGAGTVVAGDIPAGVVAAGNPARVIRLIEDQAKAWLNEKNNQ